MTKCKREGCNHEIEINPYWSVIGYCSRSCHLKDKKRLGYRWIENTLSNLEKPTEK